MAGATGSVLEPGEMSAGGGEIDGSEEIGCPTVGR